MAEPRISPAPIAAPSQPGRSPGRRALLFAAIVWSIAGAFQLLLYGGPWLVDRAVKSGLIADDLVTPKPMHPTDCAAALRELPETRPDAAAQKRARVAAYELGFNLGSAAGGRNAGSAGPDALAQLQQARALLASELGVPTPEIPPVHRVADALHEFEVHMEVDPQCIGVTLAELYSDRHDALYRFGAFAGHAVIYRSLAPELGALFVPNLRRYGQAAGLPNEVWRPLTQATSEVSRAQAQADVRAAARRVEDFLAAEMASGSAPTAR